MRVPPLESVIKDYIDRWQAAKSPWINRFNGTIYTYPEKVECDFDDEEKRDQVEQYIKKLKSHNYHYTYGRPVFIEFLRKQGSYALDNLVMHDFQLTDNITIPKGMKLLRAFKYFFSEKDDITQAQNEMNLLISQVKFSGYLHFSVDPLDYLSISENTYGWRSCHSLDGDYAAGNLEYMMDTSTIVCYIDDNTQTKLPNFPATVPWNNKRWRMLLFVSPDHHLIFASRQYPFTMTNILPIIRKCIAEFFPHIQYNPQWSNDYIDDDIIREKKPNVTIYHKHLIAPEVGRIYPLTSLYVPGAHLFYDDILHSSFYTKPYYLLGYDKYDSSAILFKPFEVGVDCDSIVCPVCGEHLFYRGEGLECSNMENELYTCECCGRRNMHEDEGMWVEDAWWCQDCVDNHAVTCSCCGELCNIENTVLNEETGEYICMNCYNHQREDRIIWQ